MQKVWGACHKCCISAKKKVYRMHTDSQNMRGRILYSMYGIITLDT